MLAGLRQYGERRKLTWFAILFIKHAQEVKEERIQPRALKAQSSLDCIVSRVEALLGSSPGFPQLCCLVQESVPLLVCRDVVPNADRNQWRTFPSHNARVQALESMDQETEQIRSKGRRKCSIEGQ